MRDEENPTIPKNVSEGNLRYPSFSKGLRRYLDSVEDYFPYAATQLSLRQHAQHAGETEKYFPEEIEMERDELRDHLSGILPRAIRGSALVVLYSAFESTVIDFSNDLARDLQRSRFVPDGRGGSFPKRANEYFAKKLNVNLFSSELEQIGIDILRQLRNSFVHDQSVFTQLRPEIRASIEES